MSNFSIRPGNENILFSQLWTTNNRCVHGRAPSPHYNNYWICVFGRAVGRAAALLRGGGGLLARAAAAPAPAHAAAAAAGGGAAGLRLHHARAPRAHLAAPLRWLCGFFGSVVHHNYTEHFIILPTNTVAMPIILINGLYFLMSKDSQILDLKDKIKIALSNYYLSSVN